jgi:MFS transporter, DHA1 family, solute carrier family 18 (vesicular amine transporter), member 1/2
MRRSAVLAVASIALATDMFVYGVAIPVLPMIAAEHGASSATVGILFACYAGALLLATPVVGVLVDRVGPRTPMLVGLLALGAATLLFAWADSFPALVAARVLQGGAAAVSWVAGFALVAAVYPAAERGRPMGIVLSATGIGILLGPLVGGVLAEQVGPAAPFYLAAALAALDGVARLVWIRDVPHVRREPSAEVYRSPRAPLLIGLTATGAGLLAFLEPIVPLEASSQYGASTQQIGFLFSGAVLLGALAAPVSGALADRLPRPALAGGGALLAAAGLAVVAAADSLWGIAVGVALTATGAQGVLAPTLVLISELAESQRPAAYGAAYAMYSLAYTAGLMVAPLAAGLGDDTAGFRATVLAGAGVAVVAGVAAATRRAPARHRA